MNISGSYESHVAISKELKMNSDFIKVREPYKENFEKIYEEAKDEKVNISNAKEFLNSLSKEELTTLQKYSGLADEIKVGKLNDEGAYNLLLHHYEKYDFDNDGFVSDGVARTTTLIPANMPDSEKKALVKSLNEMDEKDSFMAMMMINIPTSFKLENGEYVPVMNEHQNYESIMQRIDRMLNPLPGEYISPELKDTMSIFKEIFEKNYNEIKEQENKTKNEFSSSTQVLRAKLEESK